MSDKTEADCPVCTHPNPLTCRFCYHPVHATPCTVPDEDIPEWTCDCDGRDHYLRHRHRVCEEDMTEYHSDQAPDYANCINAVVHGFNRCWVHLTPEQRREYRERKSHE